MWCASSERTLSNYMHWSSIHTNVERELAEHFQLMLETEWKVHEKQVCALPVDEMKIRGGFMLSKRSGGLVSFVDLEV